MASTLVYENDEAGHRVAGNLGNLIQEVRNGASLTVVLESEKEFPPLKGGPYVYSFKAHTIHVRNGIVFATSTLDVSTTFVGNNLRFQDDSFYYMIIASTKGVLEQIRWNVGEHVARGHDQGTAFAMKWFVA
jgi:hypothetical protein